MPIGDQKVTFLGIDKICDEIYDRQSTQLQVWRGIFRAFNTKNEPIKLLVKKPVAALNFFTLTTNLTSHLA